MDTSRWAETQPQPQPQPQPADPRFYNPATQLHHPLQHQQQAPATSYLPPPYSSYAYYSPHSSNPNPNSHPSSVPLAVAPYVLSPYAPKPSAGYEAHILPHGYPAVAGVPSYYHGPAGGVQGFSVVEATNPVGYKTVRKKIGARPTSDDLETKKRKVLEGGATPNSVRVCTICNIVCNSDIVLASHLAGEKHIARAVARAPNRMNLTASSHLNPSYQTNRMIHPSYNGAMKQQAIKPAKVLQSKVLQSAYCEVCMIDCNSQDVLNNHNQGKKHRKNLEKLMGFMAVKPAMAPTITLEINETPQADRSKETKKKAATTEEDWETKKRKMLERGAMEDSVKVCSLCNVVCNSQTVFDSHIVGQKHAAMVKKEAEKEA